MFSHVLSQIPRHDFENLVKQHKADRYTTNLSTWNQFTALLYAQISGLGRLMSIAPVRHCHRLESLPSKICRNTMSHANASRDSRIYEGMFYKLLARCRDLTPKHKFKFPNPPYSIGTTTISLCLSVFPWSEIKHRRGAIKMHFQYDHSGDIPCFMVMTEGEDNDVVAAKAHFKLSRDSIYCFDRGYTDSKWFRRISDAGAYSVTRLRERVAYLVVGQHASWKGRSQGVVSDDVIELAGQGKARWQMEAFFRWVKQNLKIKTFLGTSRNAVLMQIWTAMCYSCCWPTLSIRAGMRIRCTTCIT